MTNIELASLEKQILNAHNWAGACAVSRSMHTALNTARPVIGDTGFNRWQVRRFKALACVARQYAPAMVELLESTARQYAFA